MVRVYYRWTVVTDLVRPYVTNLRPAGSSMPNDYLMVATSHIPDGKLLRPAMRKVRRPDAPAYGISKFLPRVLRDRKGTGAIEFALILPIMLALYMGSFELSLGFSMARKVSRAASTVADLVAQRSSVTAADLDQMKTVRRAHAPAPRRQFLHDEDHRNHRCLERQCDRRLVAHENGARPIRTGLR